MPIAHYTSPTFSPYTPAFAFFTVTNALNLWPARPSDTDQIQRSRAARPSRRRTQSTFLPNSFSLNSIARRPTRQWPGPEIQSPTARFSWPGESTIRLGVVTLQASGSLSLWALCRYFDNRVEGLRASETFCVMCLRAKQFSLIPATRQRIQKRSSLTLAPSLATKCFLTQ
jgi:hypothetical protein